MTAITPLQALRRLVDVARLIDADECPELYNQFQAELAVAGTVLAEPVKHTDDFAHFLSYSGLSAEPAEVLEKMRRAFEAGQPVANAPTAAPAIPVDGLALAWLHQLPHGSFFGDTENSPTSQVLLTETEAILEKESLGGTITPLCSALAAQAPQAALTDEQIQAIWNEMCFDTPKKPGWCRHIRYARAIEAAAAPNAALVEALQKIERNECQVFDEDLGGMVLVCMDTEEMVEVARAALAAAGVKP